MKPSRAAARQAVAAEQTATTVAELHEKIDDLAARLAGTPLEPTELVAGPDHTAQLDRIEAKLDQLLQALVGEPAAVPAPPASKGK